jgi:hypothetical protein
MIPPDDLRVGLYVTVMQGMRLFNHGGAAGFDDEGIKMTATTTRSECRDRSYMGDVLEITAVNHPFVVCKRHTGFMLDKPVTLDTREYELMPLTEDFVKAAKGEANESA